MVIGNIGVKPTRPELNRDHSLAKDTLICLPFHDRGGTTFRDVSGRKNHGSELSTGTSGRGRFGGTVSFADGVRHIDIKPSDQIGIPLEQVTVCVMFEKNDGTNRNSGAFGRESASATLQCSASIPRSNGRLEFNFGGFFVDTSRLRLFGLSFSGLNIWMLSVGPRGMDAWKNGELQGSHTNHVSRVATSGNFRVGSGLSFLGDNITHHFFALFTRQLSQSEIIDFSHAPFALIDRPERKKYFVPTVAAIAPGTFLRRYEGQPAPNPLLRM